MLYIGHFAGPAQGRPPAWTRISRAWFIRFRCIWARSICVSLVFGNIPAVCANTSLLLYSEKRVSVCGMPVNTKRRPIHEMTMCWFFVTLSSSCRGALDWARTVGSSPSITGFGCRPGKTGSSGLPGAARSTRPDRTGRWRWSASAPVRGCNRGDASAFTSPNLGDRLYPKREADPCPFPGSRLK